MTEKFWAKNQITFRVDPDIKSKLEDLARVRRVKNLSGLLVDILNDYVAAHEDEIARFRSLFNPPATDKNEEGK